MVKITFRIDVFLIGKATSQLCDYFESILHSEERKRIISELNFAGESAHILKKECSKPVYVIALEEELNLEIKVVQPDTKSYVKARIEPLEKKLYTLLES